MKAPERLYVEVCEDGIFAFPKPPFEESVAYIRADLVKQPVEGLEEKDFVEEVRQYYTNNCTWDALKQPMLSIITRCARHFAEWMKCKMLEDAVEGIAHPDDCEIWVNLVGYGYKFKDGDKVRIIVIKEDEK